MAQSHSNWPWEWMDRDWWIFRKPFTLPPIRAFSGGGRKGRHRPLDSDPELKQFQTCGDNDLPMSG
jgi:hypothetical protein